MNKTNLLPDKNLVLKEIISGLMSKQKYISSKFFYDKKGSKIFEKITELKEYYPSRTEKLILKNAAEKISNELQNIDIVELGSGDNSKISILLNAADKKNRNSICYIPVDISKSALKKSAQKISKAFPDIKIKTVVADFMSELRLIKNNKNRLICFFGSTLGNLNKKQSGDFMLKISNNMNAGDKFLLGLDMVKDKNILEFAYNDNKNITAKFNKNILNAVNNILKTDFNTSDFEHFAFFNKKKSRIEMHLKAIKDVQIKSPFFRKKIVIKRGETIHTENSYKYTISDIENFASICKFKIKNIFTDINAYFSLVQFIK